MCYIRPTISIHSRMHSRTRICTPHNTRNLRYSQNSPRRRAATGAATFHRRRRCPRPPAWVPPCERPAWRPPARAIHKLTALHSRPVSLSPSSSLSLSLSRARRRSLSVVLFASFRSLARVPPRSFSPSLSRTLAFLGAGARRLGAFISQPSSLSPSALAFLRIACHPTKNRQTRASGGRAFRQHTHATKSGRACTQHSTLSLSRSLHYSLLRLHASLPHLVC